MNGTDQLVALSGFMSYVASDICRSPQVYVPLLATLRESPSDDVLDLEQDRLKAIEAIEG